MMHNENEGMEVLCSIWLFFNVQQIKRLTHLKHELQKLCHTEINISL